MRVSEELRQEAIDNFIFLLHDLINNMKELNKTLKSQNDILVKVLDIVKERRDKITWVSESKQ